ncbi:MAG: ABC transporter ATP-binding protein [Candidatus Omnitrophica bacterium]|nr:ABC transporter ATP-binding protein [Candidatus Omnitrophota bacterium]
MLQAQAIRKEYKQAKETLEVLKGVDIQISAGEIVAIVGPSGAGKSTLLHIIGGLDTPTSGTVLLDGENIYRLKDEFRAKMRNDKIGFVFQFYHLLPEFNALENVMLPAFIQGTAKNNEVKERATAILTQLGLQNRLKHKPNQLSGGEQQRVAIARALINKPKIILTDEPTGNLDSASGKEIISLLIQLNETNKQTILIVTHDENIAKQCHRTIYMRDGLIEEKVLTKGRVYENLS